MLLSYYFPHRIIISCMSKVLVVDNGGGSTMCPRQGAHWEAIGFQGSDPRTDLNRSMKMLSVLQVHPSPSTTILSPPLVRAYQMSEFIVHAVTMLIHPTPPLPLLPLLSFALMNYFTTYKSSDIAHGRKGKRPHPAPICQFPGHRRNHGLPHWSQQLGSGGHRRLLALYVCWYWHDEACD
jgi:hypothetical protein